MKPRRLFSHCCVALMLFAPLTAVGQQTQTVAYVSGFVETTELNPQRVRRAIVSLRGSGRPAGYHTVTDDEGRFSLDGVPPGQYTMTASRAAFVAIPFGATEPGEPGRPVVIVAGQELFDLRLLMARGAVITGVVRDSQGEPVPSIEIEIELAGGRPWSGSRAFATKVKTDDRGEYRFYGLPAESYIVSAQPEAPSGAQGVEARAEGDIDAILLALQRRRSPERPSDMRVPPPPTPRFVDVVPIYYPSAVRREAAQPVVVRAGEERTGVDVMLFAVYR